MADEINDAPIAQGLESETNTAPPSPQPENNRPKLSDEEQLQILEGRAQRLRTKLGKDQDAPQQGSAPDLDLLQKAFLRTAGITATDEVELATATAKKWGVGVDQLVDDDDFQIKLEKLRTTKANDLATADIQGSGSTQAASQSADYWIAKGTPPTPDQVPDRKTRAAILRSMMAASKSTAKFYNDAKR